MFPLLLKSIVNFLFILKIDSTSSSRVSNVIICDKYIKFEICLTMTNKKSDENKFNLLFAGLNINYVPK